MLVQKYYLVRVVDAKIPHTCKLLSNENTSGSASSNIVFSI